MGDSDADPEHARTRTRVHTHARAHKLGDTGGKTEKGKRRVKVAAGMDGRGKK